MSLSYGFYNAVNHDRTYSAIQFGELFDGLIADGIYPNIGNVFNVTPGNGLQIKIGSGRAWFNHTWTNNTTEYPLELALSDFLLTRIDLVALEVDTRVSVRQNSLKVITGTPNVNPARPTPIMDNGLYQYPLAYVTVRPNSSTIPQSDITKMVGTSVTPYVKANLDLVSIQNAFIQWEGEFEEWMESVTNIADENEVVALRIELDKIKPRVDAMEPAMTNLEASLQAIQDFLKGV